MGAKDKILAASEEFFANCGYDHTTVKMICEQAGVNIAAVNYHFNSKSDLYLATIQSISGTINKKLEQLFSIDVSEKAPRTWHEVIHEFVSLVLIDEDDKSNRWHTIIMRELSTPSELFDDIYEQYIKPVLDYLSELFVIFYPQLSETTRSMWITTLLSQLSFIINSRGLLIKREGEAYYSEENIAVLVDHITRTMSLPASSSVAKSGGDVQ